MSEALGVKHVINATGTVTILGGSLMPPEVVAAWADAAKHFVDLLDLQNKVGERIAKLIGVEAAMVTTGAAGESDRREKGCDPAPTAERVFVLKLRSRSAEHAYAVLRLAVLHSLSAVLQVAARMLNQKGAHLTGAKLCALNPVQPCTCLWPSARS